MAKGNRNTGKPPAEDEPATSLPPDGSETTAELGASDVVASAHAQGEVIPGGVEEVPGAVDLAEQGKDGPVDTKDTEPALEAHVAEPPDVNDFEVGPVLALADETAARDKKIRDIVLRCPDCSLSRPCSVEHWVAAGYKAEDYETAFPPEPPKPAAIRPGHKLCKVVGTQVYGGYPLKNHGDGSFAQFTPADIASAPEHIIPVEEEADGLLGAGRPRGPTF